MLLGALIPMLLRYYMGNGLSRENVKKSKSYSKWAPNQTLDEFMRKR